MPGSGRGVARPCPTVRFTSRFVRAGHASESHPSVAALECGADCACAVPCPVLLPRARADLCPVAGHGPVPAGGARPEGTQLTQVECAAHESECSGPGIVLGAPSTDSV